MGRIDDTLRRANAADSPLPGNTRNETTFKSPWVELAESRPASVRQELSRPDETTVSPRRFSPEWARLLTVCSSLTRTYGAPLCNSMWIGPDSWTQRGAPGAAAGKAGNHQADRDIVVSSRRASRSRSYGRIDIRSYAPDPRTRRRGVFDWVILDVPPIRLVPDAGLLASMVDAVLFVVRAGVTPHGQLQKAHRSRRKRSHIRRRTERCAR